MKKPKVLVALSGGVDSSVAAIMLKHEGYNLIGVTLNLYNTLDYGNYQMSQSINDAVILANRIEIPYYIVDFSKEFENIVINDFIQSYINGFTPNPCALCNYSIKWGKLLELADEFGCEYIATGHYACINQSNGRYYISSSKDETKDQSYFLWRLGQHQLKRTLFPLGRYKKEEIKQFAAANGYERLAKKRESYNICFIPDGDYRSFIHNKVNKQAIENDIGSCILESGEIIGKYHGIWNYTIGQRKGLIHDSDIPLYILKLDTEKKQVILGSRQELFKDIAFLSPFNLTKYTNLTDGMELKAKYRYKIPAEMCKVKIETDRIIVKFANPVSSLAPGQSIALYHENDLIGGGIIVNACNSVKT